MQTHERHYLSYAMSKQRTVITTHAPLHYNPKITISSRKTMKQYNIIFVPETGFI